MDAQISLLEWLAVQTGQSYVSDLRNDMRSPELTRALRSALSRAPHALWSVAEWRQAGHYLLRAEVRFSTVEEALSYFKAHI